MAMVGLAAGVTDRILSLPGWLVLVLVFAFPALEASAFVGFVFPGEIAVILGGVAASRGVVPLWAVIAAAVSGAIIGDSMGYLVGRRWGTHLLHGTVGRLPVIRSHLDKNLDSARAYVQRRQGSAVFFGRFTAALRVLVPGLAGLSEVRYPAFLAYNVAGGTLWGAGFAVLGYVAGASYHRVEHIAGPNAPCRRHRDQPAAQQPETRPAKGPGEPLDQDDQRRAGPGSLLTGLSARGRGNAGARRLRAGVLPGPGIRAGRVRGPL